MKRICFTAFLCFMCQFSIAQDDAEAAATSAETTATESADETNYLNQPRYISDVLFVPLRSGQSNAHRIIHRGLKSGTQVTLLETNEESGFSLVRTHKGVEGWLRNQYLVDSPTANILLDEANRTIKQLSSKAGPLSDKLLESEKLNRQLKRDVEKLEREKNHLDKELDRIKNLSTNVISIDEDNKKLLKQNEIFKNERDTLKAENERLEQELKNDDLINGAYILLLGIIATLVVQYFTNTKRRTEWA